MSTTITVGQYKTFVRNRLDEDDFSDAYLLQFANDTNREICASKRWRFLEETFTGTVQAGYTKYSLPNDFQAAINFVIQDPNANATFLTYMPYEIYDQTYPDPTALAPATPSIWTVFGDSLIVGPAAPDKTYTMQLRYLRVPATLAADTDTIDIPDEFAELMTLGMYRRALMVNDQFDQAQIIQYEFQTQMELMMSRLQARQFGSNVKMNNGTNATRNLTDYRM